MSRSVARLAAVMGIALPSALVANPAGAKADDPLAVIIESARDEVYPALVHISVRSRSYEKGQARLTKVGNGSGVIIDAEGHVVTNHHVAGKAEKITVTLANLEEVGAKRVGTDPWTDLALLKLDLDRYRGPALQPARLAPDRSAKTGEFVLAMGSPFGLSRSVSFGVISNVDRYIRPGMRLPSGEETGLFNNWIQTDAAINPGNSGGPLVNLRGEVVGINSRGVRLANNIGLAIPAHIVRPVVEQLREHGKVTRSYFGIAVKEAQGLALGVTEARGAIVSDVPFGSPADRAGLIPGDLILKVDGEPVPIRFREHILPFNRKLAELPVGEPTGFIIERSGEETTLEIRPEDLKESTGEAAEDKVLGITFQTVPRRAQVLLELGERPGVVVTSLSNLGVASLSGLAKDDVILAIDGKPFRSVDEFRKAVSEIDRETGALAKIHRKGAVLYRHLKWP